MAILYIKEKSSPQAQRGCACAPVFSLRHCPLDTAGPGSMFRVFLEYRPARSGPCDTLIHSALRLPLLALLFTAPLVALLPHLR